LLLETISVFMFDLSRAVKLVTSLTQRNLEMLTYFGAFAGSQTARVFWQSRKRVMIISDLLT
jgi:hypothetical protein